MVAVVFKEHRAVRCALHILPFFAGDVLVSGYIPGVVWFTEDHESVRRQKAKGWNTLTKCEIVSEPTHISSLNLKSNKYPVYGGVMHMSVLEFCFKFGLGGRLVLSSMVHYGAGR